MVTFLYQFHRSGRARAEADAAKERIFAGSALALKKTKSEGRDARSEALYHKKERRRAGFRTIAGKSAEEDGFFGRRTRLAAEPKGARMAFWNTARAGLHRKKCFGIWRSRFALGEVLLF